MIVPCLSMLGFSDDIACFKAAEANVISQIEVVPWKLTGDLPADFTYACIQSILSGVEGDLFQHNKDILTRLAKTADFMARHGIPKAVLGSPKMRDGLGGDPFQFFDKADSLFAARGVKLLLEPNASTYGCSFVTTHKEGLDYLRRHSGRGWTHIGLNCDIGNMIENDENFAGIDKVEHVHLSAPGLGDIFPFEDKARAILATAPQFNILSLERLPGPEVLRDIALLKEISC